MVFVLIYSGHIGSSSVVSRMDLLEMKVDNLEMKVDNGFEAVLARLPPIVPSVSRFSNQTLP